MNQEIAEFFVKFTTKNFEEVKDALDSLSKKMDDVGEASEKASKKQGGFFDKIGGKGWGWLGRITSLTTAVWGLKKAWDAVGNAAASTMTLHQQAMLAGVNPQTLERWQWVAKHYGDKNTGAIFGDFRSGYQFLQQFQDVEIGEEFNKVFGRAGLRTDAIIESLEAGNLDAIFTMLNEALSARDINGNALVNAARAKQVLDQIGFSDSMQILLRLQNLPEALATARLMYSNPETLEASVKYQDAKETLKDSWNAIWANPELIDKATNLMNLINDQVIPKLDAFVNWLIAAINRLMGGDDPNLTKEENMARARWNNAIKGAAVGAAAGSVVPGLGTLTGAVLGAAGGLIGTAAGQVQETSLQSQKNLEALWSMEQQGIVNQVVDTDGTVRYVLDRDALDKASATAIVNVNGREVARATGGESAFLDYDNTLIPSNTH